MPRCRNTSLVASVPLAAARLAAAVAGVVSNPGCENYHNEGERLEYKRYLDAQERALYPDAGAAESSGFGYNPPDPSQCPNNSCLADPGSRLISADECRLAERDVEFLAIPIWDFDDNREGAFNDLNKNRLLDPAEAGETNVTERFALHAYVYTDDTTYNLYPFGWEPPTIPDPFRRCGLSDNHVFHIAGGPFLGWGGGLGRSLRCLNGYESGNDRELQAPQAVVDQMRVAHGWGLTTTADAITPAGFHNENDGNAKIFCHYGPDTGRTRLTQGACTVSEQDPKTGPLCPRRDRGYQTTGEVTPAEDAALLGQAIDLSDWDGISFWARRGPNGQPGIRILIGDKYTDDDISFMQYLRDPNGPRYCERSFECACKSTSRPCTTVTEAEAVAVNAALNAAHYQDILSEYPRDSEAYLSSKEHLRPNSYNLNPLLPGDSICWDRQGPDAINLAARSLQFCGQSACRHQTDSGKSLNVGRDPYVFDTTCQSFSFRGSITSDFCYEPDSSIAAQHQPFESSQTCGDHWMKSIEIGLDWQFYQIPFTELLQQGWAKRSYKLDLTAVTLARITWDRGYVDLYIDDVNFYRMKRPDE